MSHKMLRTFIVSVRINLINDIYIYIYIYTYIYI